MDKGCVFPYIGITFTCYSTSAKVTFVLCMYAITCLLTGLRVLRSPLNLMGEQL
ncbi:hypothetical protein [Pseudanabaena sp. UWO311]|uniref:hypothetical protein n=1 Tax=Pseudanabaena sp. UWO311 TaxID=2487337 RepID=UPI00167FE36A|nr:hypothetical protein [Pseudanabaena sp. UWO311]